MNQKQPTQYSNDWKNKEEFKIVLTEVSAQIANSTTPIIIEAITVQLFTAREARSRIDIEGSIVRDMRGSVIPHPAIKVEADAMKIYVDLMSKHKIRKIN